MFLPDNWRLRSRISCWIVQPYRVSDIDSSELWIVAQDTLDGLYEAFECHSKEILWLCALENTKLRMPVKGLEIMESREKQQQLENTDGTTNKTSLSALNSKSPTEWKFPYDYGWTHPSYQTPSLTSKHSKNIAQVVVDWIREEYWAAHKDCHTEALVTGERCRTKDEPRRWN